jgi:hypothetical protein
MAYRARRMKWAAVAPRDLTVDAPRRPGRPPAFLPSDFEPVMPSQWLAGRRRTFQPAERLMLAVLTDALDLVLQKPALAKTRRALLQRKAADWIRADDRASLFSFLNISETLGFDANRLRVNVARLVERDGRPG